MRASTTIATITLLLLALVLTPLLTGCNGGDGGGNLRLLGTVRDAGSLQGIAGARVVAKSVEATTDANGDFDLPNAPSSGQVVVTASGYENANVAIPPATDEVDLGNIDLVPAPIAGTGNITGIITEAGLLVDGAVVRAGGREARTRADGSYTIYNVPAGFQTVFAVSPNNTTAGTMNVSVFSLMTITANIQLTTQPPPPPL